jgi:SPP1 family predicted phage head-tail adaptor
MRSGLLRHVINLERRKIEFNDLGHQVTAWKPVITGLRATVTTLSGRELEQARQQHAEASVSVTTRFVDAKTTDRFRWLDRVLEIAAVVVNERGTQATYLCTEHLA